MLKADKMKQFIPSDHSEKTIATADVLIVTGVTLVNHTLESILSKSQRSIVFLKFHLLKTVCIQLPSSQLLLPGNRCYRHRNHGIDFH